MTCAYYVPTVSCVSFAPPRRIRACASPCSPRACSPCAPGLFFFIVLPLLATCAPFRKLCFALFLFNGVATLLSRLIRCTNECGWSASSCVASSTVKKEVPLPAAAEGGKAKVSTAASQATWRADLSSVDITSDEKTRVQISAPGLRTEDLDVTIVENVLRVRGESRRGTTTFGIDRRIELPSDVDGDTAAATHEDGVLTITMDSKAMTRLRVHPVVTSGARQDVPASETENDHDVDSRQKQNNASSPVYAEASSSSSDGDHDEWESLPAMASDETACDHSLETE